MPVVLSFDGVVAGDRAEFWRDACTRTFVGVEPSGRPGEAIGGRVRAYEVDGLAVGDIAATAQSMSRTQRLVDDADSHYVLLGMQVQGMGGITQGDRQIRLDPGDCVVLDSRRRFELDFAESFNLWVFAFPQHLVRLGEQDQRRLAAQRVSARTGLAAVSRRALLDLARNADELSRSQSPGALALANDLLVALLSEPLAESRQLAGSLQRTLPLRIKDHIDRNLADPGLDPVQVADAFGISTRYLHKLFRSERETVAHYIRDRRLERVRLRLLDSRFADRPVSALAFDAGFGDLSGFNRAFKAKYGVSPRELRQGK
ncbi:helix-turn-helix domain-containing protein [Streptomyces sp. F001]|uniref:helix-turn-helix domain-containing protein n=1 Tax=Streptomyces sp. F001 TaxID=1510026 RepID=UPI00101E27B3|nr:helix-turn-helix domain-containing protein [Streptomyces sp. F001]RZB15189.1 helix-turn-helix domain-containing protein [Streptomyces sp. F001]